MRRAYYSTVPAVRHAQCTVLVDTRVFSFHRHEQHKRRVQDHQQVVRVPDVCEHRYALDADAHRRRHQQLPRVDAATTTRTQMPATLSCYTLPARGCKAL
jgi:hypothetical protein